MGTQFHGPGHNQAAENLNKSDFQLADHQSQSESKRQPTAFDYEIWKQAEKELNPQHSGRYFFSSLVLHGLIAFGALFYSLQMLHKEEIETVEVEFFDPGQVTSPTAPISQEPEPSVAPVPAPVAEEKIAKDDVVVPPPPPAPKAVTPPPVAKEVVKPTPAPAPAPKPAPVQAAKPAPVAPKTVESAPIKTFVADSPVEVKDNVDDIESPELEEPKAIVATPPKLDEKELQDDFAKVDEAQKAQALAVAQDLDKESEKALKETEALAQQVAAESNAEAEKIAAYNAARRARDAQAIAAAKAAEEAAAARAAQARAAEEKAGMGGGSGNGMPTGVKSLENFRQRPGNPRPYYNMEERLNRQEGEVIYVAYITKEGVPTQFKMIKSSGHDNLDKKTLAALQRWRFYAGQEGWVELPFKWELKGEVQEAPALLKRK